MLLEQEFEPRTDEADTRTDEEILALSILEPRLFGKIVDRYQDAFVRKAERVLQTREEAEDVTQEAFTKIYVNASRFRPVEGASFKSWAYKILMHTAFTRYQKLKRERGVRVEFDPDSFELVPDMVDSWYEVETIKNYVATTLARMPDKLSNALKFHFLDDKSQKEIADKEGVAVGVIKTRVLRAKRAFRKITDSQSPDNS